MVDVAFVCLGNICRSTMAEAIMRQRLKERGISDVIVHSRGTGRWNLGEPPHQGTQKILKQHHIPFDGIVEPVDNFVILSPWTKVMWIILNQSIQILKVNCSNC